MYARPADVYAFLCDMRRFAVLLPTYVSHVDRGGGITDVTVAVGLGRFRGRATVRLRLVETDGRERARYEGDGRVFGGRFKLHANFVVRPFEGGSTRVSWDGSLNMAGRLLAKVGEFVRPVAERHIDHLIDGVQRTLSPPRDQALPSRPKPV
ncbi:MAG: SRPBCC family protein [Gammaproteobacteria bacterium]|nr:SRPBCC family protein [Gammaproteobacteria bacterium]MBT8444958.1 SRPBCC family protein [Gammaproteobacteria bacterium]NND36735.1 hypothetical protein [Gammaproteobacteria bacterium]